MGFAVMSLSDAAAGRVKAIVENAGGDARGIRVSVKKGGCAGMEYAVDLVTEPNPKDDLIERDGAQVIFIEVKQSKTHAMAAEHLTARQMARIYRAASEFLAGEPAGQLTDVRFDVALVDAVGRIEVLENAYAA